jgi:hypothetical protein
MLKDTASEGGKIKIKISPHPLDPPTKTIWRQHVIGI